MQSHVSHTGTACVRILLCVIMLALQSGSIAAGPKGSGQDPVANAAVTRTFQTSFISLSPGHAIAASLLVFSGENTFEIQIPGVTYLDPSGACTKNGLFFKADFATSVLKQKKHFRYTFSAQGASFFDRYIAGIMVLEERIEETGQQQKVTFVFWGASEAAGSDEEKNLFPF